MSYVSVRNAVPFDDRFFFFFFFFGDYLTTGLFVSGCYLQLYRLNIFYCRKTKGLDTSYKQHYIVLSLNVTSNLQMVQQ